MLTKWHLYQRKISYQGGLFIFVLLLKIEKLFSTTYFLHNNIQTINQIAKARTFQSACVRGGGVSNSAGEVFTFYSMHIHGLQSPGCQLNTQLHWFPLLIQSKYSVCGFTPKEYKKTQHRGCHHRWPPGPAAL